MNTPYAFITLELIDPNPDQVFSTFDETKVIEIMESIQSNRDNGKKGLWEVPTARKVDGRYQLAFGHHRKEAFRRLALEDSFFSDMPLLIEDLTDKQMFEAMGIENMNRREITILEIGETFERYMTKFNANSVETGAAFGKSEEYVRSAVRMLNLPLIAKDAMRAGDLNINASRSILTLTRVLPNDEETLNEVLRDIKEGEKPEEVVEQALRMNKNTKIIRNETDNGDFSSKQKSFKYLPELTVTEAQHHCGVETGLTYHDKGVWKLRIEKLSKGTLAIDLPGADVAEEFEIMRKIQDLVKPPACTACPMFATIDGMGYCGWVACFDRKKAAQDEANLHKVSETTGIAVYTKEDGTAKVISTWREKHSALFSKKNADLRLRLSGTTNYNNFPNIPVNMQVVVIGKTLEALKKAEEKQAAQVDARHDTPKGDYERERAIQKIVEGQISLFAWEQAVPAFVKLLEGIACVGLLETIEVELGLGFILNMPNEAGISDAEFKKMKKPAQLALLRKRIVYQSLEGRMKYNDSQKIVTSKTPVIAFAKYLQGLATTWGVKLPEDFLDKAAELDKAVKLAIAELDKKDGDE